MEQWEIQPRDSITPPRSSLPTGTVNRGPPSFTPVANPQSHPHNVVNTPVTVPAPAPAPVRASTTTPVPAPPPVTVSAPASGPTAAPASAPATTSATAPVPVTASATVPASAPTPGSATAPAPMLHPMCPNAVPYLGCKPPPKKRKSTDADLDDTDDLGHIGIDHLPMTDNCDQVRRKINRFIDSGVTSKAKFAREIGVSAKSLSGFMGESGAMKGEKFAAYRAAWEYFTRREIAGLKFPAVKKAKPLPASAASGKVTAAPGANNMNCAGIDISDITLDGEMEDKVPVFDSCDEVRRKISVVLRKEHATQAQLGRDILAQFHAPGKPGQIQGSQIARFRGMRGPYSGTKHVVYYGAYVFLEKVRIKEGKPKTKHRLEMEKEWGPEGIDRTTEGGGSLYYFAGEKF